MEQVDLDKIRLLCKTHKVIWKDHATKRMKMRNIKSFDVEHCIAVGEIIEHYFDDYPAASCLVLGSSFNNQPLHVVCSVYQEYLCIITTYFPNPTEWNDDCKTRKVVLS